jgi:hypothetical protein
MRDQKGALEERALSVPFDFHFITDLLSRQPFFHQGKTASWFAAAARCAREAS